MTDSDTQHMIFGGRSVWANYIVGHLRPREQDNREKLDELVQEIMKLWNLIAKPTGYSSVVPREGKKLARREIEKMKQNEEIERKADLNAPGRLDDERGLHNIFVMDDIAAGMQQGFILPPVGQDAQWVQDDMSKIEARARLGERAMQALVEEIKNGLGTRATFPH